MEVRVNGEVMALESPCTVGELLEQLELSGGACAVEVNTEVVPKREHDICTLSDGDTVEIVTLVGGG
ncbi:MAG: sulfur carrier protein ThiS [Planctomycetota bacterium]|jgi:thiamine biosynthesis protein ThiS